MQKEILPVLDLVVLQQKADEAAMKGAINSIEEFYSGYNSPYKKAITDKLQNKGVDPNFDLPDIIGVLNDKFTKEVDLIANTAVAKSFLPMLKEFLSREDAEIKFSNILRKFIDRTEFKYDNEKSIEDYTVERISKYEDSSVLKNTFFSYIVSDGKLSYELLFYKHKDVITMSSLPYILDESGRFNHYEIKQKMKVSLDGGATLELPFTKGILEDDFISFVARLVIGNNSIVFDVEDFNDEMFPPDECHC